MSPYRATMLYTEGVSYLLEADPGRAGPILAHAFDVAISAGAAPLVALVLAERAIAASEFADWPAAQAFTEKALAIVATVTSRTTGPAPWCTPGRPASPPIRATSLRPACMSPTRPACGPCSLTRCQLFPPKPYSSWLEPTLPSETPAASEPCCAKLETSSSNDLTSASYPSRPQNCEPSSLPLSETGGASSLRVPSTTTPVSTHNAQVIVERLYVRSTPDRAISVQEVRISTAAAVAAMHELGLLTHD